MKAKVFIDGQEGTTGLQLRERLEKREDLQLLSIEEERRKDPVRRKQLLNEADYAFLCLPDAAARESVSLVENPHVRILDASTAHRTEPGWAYGFPELSEKHRQDIAASSRVAVPGCYASGFNALLYPLVSAGLVAPYHPVTCFAVSGYSGAGKKAIAQYESPDKPESLFSPRMYALTLQHKHLKEMTAVSGLAFKPLFTPIVDDYYKGMLVCVPLTLRALSKRVEAAEIQQALAQHYKGQHFVEVMPYGGEDLDQIPALENGFLSATGLNGTNHMQLFVFGNGEQVLLAARLDNLGKGASGAAMQCLNIMMGVDEAAGLE